MVQKIIFGLFFFCLIIAIPLSALGIRQVELGPTFIAFLNQTSQDLSKWQLKIPDIPDIPSVPMHFANSNFLEVLINILNVLIGFFNFLIDFINVIIGMLNFVIMWTQYLFTLVKNLIAFKDTLARIGSA